MVASILSNPALYDSIDRRFQYGELRLTRLNKIYFYWHTPGAQYRSQWNQYSSFFEENLAFIAGIFAYVVIILTALQVGLATDLVHNAAFKSASHRFTIIVILGLVAALGLLAFVFLYLFVNNWMHTKRLQKKRKKEFVDYKETIPSLEVGLAM